MRTSASAWACVTACGGEAAEPNITKGESLGDGLPGEACLDCIGFEYRPWPKDAVKQDSTERNLQDPGQDAVCHYACLEAVGLEVRPWVKAAAKDVEAECKPTPQDPQDSVLKRLEKLKSRLEKLKTEEAYLAAFIASTTEEAYKDVTSAAASAATAAASAAMAAAARAEVKATTADKAAAAVLVTVLKIKSVLGGAARMSAKKSRSSSRAQSDSDLRRPRANSGLSMLTPDGSPPCTPPLHTPPPGQEMHYGLLVQQWNNYLHEQSMLLRGDLAAPPSLAPHSSTPPQSFAHSERKSLETLQAAAAALADTPSELPSIIRVRARSVSNGQQIAARSSSPREREQHRPSRPRADSGLSTSMLTPDGSPPCTPPLQLHTPPASASSTGQETVETVETHYGLLVQQWSNYLHEQSLLRRGMATPSPLSSLDSTPRLNTNIRKRPASPRAEQRARASTNSTNSVTNFLNSDRAHTHMRLRQRSTASNVSSLYTPDSTPPGTPPLHTPPTFGINSGTLGESESQSESQSETHYGLLLQLWNEYLLVAQERKGERRGADKAKGQREVEEQVEVEVEVKAKGEAQLGAEQEAGAGAGAEEAGAGAGANVAAEVDLAAALATTAAEEERLRVSVSKGIIDRVKTFEKRSTVVVKEADISITPRKQPQRGIMSSIMSLSPSNPHSNRLSLRQLFLGRRAVPNKIGISQDQEGQEEEGAHGQMAELQ